MYDLSCPFFLFDSLMYKNTLFPIHTGDNLLRADDLAKGVQVVYTSNHKLKYFFFYGEQIANW